MLEWSYHWVLQLRARGYEHWLLLGDTRRTCEALHKGWAPMVETSTASARSRAHSKTVPAQPSRLVAVGGQQQCLHIVGHALVGNGAHAAARRQCADLGVDAVHFSDVYALLRSPPLGAYDVVITKNADGSGSLNCGFVYFNRDASLARLQAAKAPPQLLRTHLHLSLMPPQTATPADGDGGDCTTDATQHAPGVGSATPAASWVAGCSTDCSSSSSSTGRRCAGLRRRRYC